MSDKKIILGLLTCMFSLSAESSFSQSTYPSGPSGIAPVTITISSAAASATFLPIAGRTVYVSFTAGTGIGTCQLEGKFDGTNWSPFYVGVAGQSVQLNAYSLTATSAFTDSFVIDQPGVYVRLNCSSSVTGGGWVSGTINGVFTQ